MSASSPPNWDDDEELGQGPGREPLPYGEPGPIMLGFPGPPPVAPPSALQPAPRPPPSRPVPQLPAPLAPPAPVYTHPPEVFGAPPRRVVRPEPTYPAPYNPQPEAPKQYFTPLPSFMPAPAPPAEPAPTLAVVVRAQGWQRGLFIGCAVGVIVGGVAGMVIERMHQPKKFDVILAEPKPPVQAAALTEEPTPAAPRKAAKAQVAKAAPKTGSSVSRPTPKSLDFDRLERSIGEPGRPQDGRGGPPSR